MLRPQPAAECVRAGKTVEDRQRDGRQGAVCAPEPQRRSGEGGASPAGCGRGRGSPEPAGVAAQPAGTASASVLRSRCRRNDRGQRSTDSRA